MPQIIWIIKSTWHAWLRMRAWKNLNIDFICFFVLCSLSYQTLFATEALNFVYIWMNPWMNVASACSLEISPFLLAINFESGRPSCCQITWYHIECLQSATDLQQEAKWIQKEIMSLGNQLPIHYIDTVSQEQFQPIMLCTRDFIFENLLSQPYVQK